MGQYVDRIENLTKGDQLRNGSNTKLSTVQNIKGNLCLAIDSIDLNGLHESIDKRLSTLLNLGLEKIMMDSKTSNGIVRWMKQFEDGGAGLDA